MQLLRDIYLFIYFRKVGDKTEARTDTVVLKDEVRRLKSFKKKKSKRLKSKDVHLQDVI